MLLDRRARTYDEVGLVSEVGDENRHDVNDGELRGRSQSVSRASRECDAFGRTDVDDPVGGSSSGLDREKGEEREPPGRHWWM